METSAALQQHQAPGQPASTAAAEQPHDEAARSQAQAQTCVVLFYKYHPLSEDAAETETYRSSLEKLCRALCLSGRILVGCARNEGINGTLAGERCNVRAFVTAMCGGVVGCADELSLNEPQNEAQRLFGVESRDFFASIGAPVLRMEESDFKWSVGGEPSPDNGGIPDQMFPDLQVKLVKELIGSGGAMSAIPLDETAQGYLTPQQWHEELLQLQRQRRRKPSSPRNTSDSDDDVNYNAGVDDGSGVVLIDCRNTKEYAIGHFEHAIDPKTTTFSLFPQWVSDHEHLLANKKVYMYCTGGIRCEKASAYIRRTVPSVREVKHLKGGIHKYLEEYGQLSSSRCDGGDPDEADVLWKGRNFVFDGRGAASAEETHRGRDGGERTLADSGMIQPTSGGNLDEGLEIVGRCISCHQPHDRFDPSCVCTVCREPTLVCDACQTKLHEFHCREHQSWKSCYFSNLDRFVEDELQRQSSELKAVFRSFAVGRKFKAKRRTLSKQIARIGKEIELRQQGQAHAAPTTPGMMLVKCRHCDQVGCSGRCWGFYGLKRKEMLAQQQIDRGSKVTKVPKISPQVGSLLDESQAQASKHQKQEALLEEVAQLRLSLPPSAHREPVTGVRVPPCTTRIVQCFAKGKWCGQNVISIVKQEFAELSRPSTLHDVLQEGLLLVNDRTVDPMDAAHVKIRMNDVIGRIVHWHEPPVLVPSSIQVEARSLPTFVTEEFKLRPESRVYVCNKPASVPVHPAGPYQANTLTLMVEAQQNLPALSLSPLHRTDRVTSGLTLCSDDSSLSRLFHRCMTHGLVRKLYLSQVRGRFYARSVSDKEGLAPTSLSIGRCAWVGEALQVDAPVETVDPANGVRAVTAKGKPSCSRFLLISYDPSADTSLLACFPVTGRNHQLRVHLQLLGYPIVGDVQYGGQSLGSAEEARIATQLMQQAICDDSLCLPSLTKENVQAAKRACACCRRGAAAAFTQAQLLQGGHAIRLHALKYQLSFVAPGKAGDSQVSRAVVDFQVDPPEWAGHFDMQTLQTMWHKGNSQVPRCGTELVCEKLWDA